MVVCIYDRIKESLIGLDVYRTGVFMTNDTEVKARIKINKLLEEAGWRLLYDENGQANVDLEYTTKIKRDDKFKTGILDYLLLDSKGFPLCVLEAKRTDIDPLWAKEQAREYANSQNIRI